MNIKWSLVLILLVEALQHLIKQVEQHEADSSDPDDPVP
jgi:hypothetical protein